VLPLGNAALFNYHAMDKLTPEITYRDEKLLLIITPQISPVPAKLLTKPIESLSHFRENILQSLDFAISGI
jgi:toxin CcdB